MPLVYACSRRKSIQKLGARKTLVKPVVLQTKGVASSDVLTQIMGVSPIPPVEEAGWFTEYTAKIENGTYEDADGLTLRQKLEVHFGLQHPLMLDADRLIRFQAFKLRKKSTPQD
jgi:predicted ATP-binding protein involved in virulence